MSLVDRSRGVIESPQVGIWERGFRCGGTDVGGWPALPMLWSQASTPDPSLVPLLALRRWYGSLTLSSPDPAPNRFGLWTWLLGLGALLLVCVVVQGPGRALRQLFDIP